RPHRHRKKAHHNHKRQNPRSNPTKDITVLMTLKTRENPSLRAQRSNPGGLAASAGPTDWNRTLYGLHGKARQ
ncbi:hypothetical protein, partial [Rhodobium gokarnense]|uniref:hypothetical protein n=1 Tax=Rhodobium gokarnense TaxID=364296 RepID=UPI0022245CF3